MKTPFHAWRFQRKHLFTAEIQDFGLQSNVEVALSFSRHGS